MLSSVGDISKLSRIVMDLCSSAPIRATLGREANEALATASVDNSLNVGLLASMLPNAPTILSLPPSQPNLSLVRVPAGGCSCGHVGSGRDRARRPGWVRDGWAENVETVPRSILAAWWPPTDVTRACWWSAWVRCPLAPG